ncbi:MAG: hypothetical protein CMJ50_08470 [Planctomycetaceae bacterium]|nr:hypothetical protein [Planctomycetaceae bacterium]
MGTKPKRHRFLRFSLRATLLVLTVFSAWLGVQVNRANNQRSVVGWLTENGGGEHYDWELDRDGQPSGRPKPPGPAWLREQIGDKYFQSVVGVDAHAAEVHDLSPLSKLNELKFLHLGGTQVNDLSPLANLSNLEWLSLAETQINDLSPLAKLSNLKRLHLDGTQISNLAPLASLTRLEYLRIERTLVTDEEVRDLQKALSNCEISRSQ